eukprot:2860911-Pyramimonas_sp.AAC.2
MTPADAGWEGGRVLGHIDYAVVHARRRHCQIVSSGRTPERAGATLGVASSRLSRLSPTNLLQGGGVLSPWIKLTGLTSMVWQARWRCACGWMTTAIWGRA